MTIRKLKATLKNEMDDVEDDRDKMWKGPKKYKQPVLETYLATRNQTIQWVLDLINSKPKK